MTGDKPDPRLRTPMQWSRGPAAGFTRGVPWEPLQPDSLTANVEALETDPNSLLNLYRRLIHLRAENSALGSGELVPLEASSDAVAAYVRRDGGRAVLVVANLGAVPLNRVTVSSEGSVLPPGEYEVRSLLGGQSGASLTVERNGLIERYVALPTLESLASHVFELTFADSR